jgi:hypothetical protein
MGATRTQRIREATEAERQGLIAPDSAETVHEFADGWRIVRLATVGDVRREGRLMRNCLPKYVGDELIEDTKCDYAPGAAGDDEPAPHASAQMVFEHDLSRYHASARLHSLRDETGLPHLSFWVREPLYACGIWGYKNSEPRDKYMARLQEWKDAGGVQDVLGRDARGHSLMLFWNGTITREGSRLIDRWHGVERVFAQRGLIEPRQHDKLWHHFSQALVVYGHAARLADHQTRVRRITAQRRDSGEMTPQLELAWRASRRRHRQQMPKLATKARRHERELERELLRIIAATPTARAWHTPRRRSAGRR